MGQIVEFGGSRGFLAVPDAAARGAVIVIQEWWGLVPHIESVAQRLADEGFVALAPDFYNGAVTTEPDEAATLMMKVRLSEASSLIANAASYLVGRDDAHSPVACIGFCMGGALALLAGTVSSDIGVAVGFYPATPWGDYAPDWSAYAGKTAVVHADQDDGGIEAENLVAIGAAVTSAGGSYLGYDYPGTHHAFFNDDRPDVYDPVASGLAWERTLAALQTITT